MKIKQWIVSDSVLSHIRWKVQEVQQSNEKSDVKPPVESLQV